MGRKTREAKEKLIAAANALFTAGGSQHGGHGNLSARLDRERIVITGRGTIRHLTFDDFAVVSMDGELLDGDLEPANAEIVRMHTGVYGAREDAGAVIHTHSPYATSFALAGQP